MANPLTLQEFADLYDPRFREVMDGVKERSVSRIGDFYTKESSDQLTERGTALTPMGNFQQFTGDGSIRYDGPDQGYDWNATHVEYALGLQIQRRLWRFDQFNVISSRWELLGDSAFETKEVHAAQFFLEGDDNTSLLNFTHTRAEAPFANTHATTRSGVSTSAGFDNLHAAALNRTSLNAIRIQGLKFKDDAGRVRGMNFDTLIIPPDLINTAEELTQSSKQPDNANNAINVHEGRLRIIVWDQLTDANDYWVVNLAALKKNLKWYEADPLEYDRVLDFETKIAKYSGYMQYTTAWADWRVGVGAYVT